MRGQATLPQKVDPGAFNAQRQVWKTPKRTLLVDPPQPYMIYIYIYIYHTPMVRYSLYVLKVLLNTNKQTNKYQVRNVPKHKLIVTVMKV